MLRRRKRNRKGQSLVETMAGFFILIPLGLFFFDLVTMMTAGQTNEQWAEIASRAAATQTSEQMALKSAETAISKCTTTSVIQNVQIEAVKFDTQQGQVSVSTVMTVKLPVPFPYFNQVQLRAAAIEPIVSAQAPW